MNTATMTRAQMDAWEDASVCVDDSRLFTDNDFDAESAVEAIPSYWLEAIPSLGDRDCDQPVDVVLFSALRGDGIHLTVQGCEDGALLLTLALTLPEQWGVLALNRIRELGRKGDDYRRWVGIVEERAGVAA